jgi:TATA-binding protein-associated factor Taf7
VLAAAWKFLGIAPTANEGPLDSLYALARRIRKADSLAELETIEDEIDDILKAERAKAADGDESAVDATTLNVAAHRLENLIHDRQQMLASGSTVVARGRARKFSAVEGFTCSMTEHVEAHLPLDEPELLDA